MAEELWKILLQRTTRNLPPLQIHPTAGTVSYFITYEKCSLSLFISYTRNWLQYLPLYTSCRHKVFQRPHYIKWGGRVCSRGTVHSIGGKGTGCCLVWPLLHYCCSSRSCTWPLSIHSWQLTITHRPHCKSCNNLTVASLKTQGRQYSGRSETAIKTLKRQRNGTLKNFAPLLQSFSQASILPICKDPNSTGIAVLLSWICSVSYRSETPIETSKRQNVYGSVLCTFTALQGLKHHPKAS